MIDSSKGPCDAGVIQAGAAAVTCAEDIKPWVLAATILGSSVAFINSSVVNVALPAIQAGLSATAVEMQWVLNAYLLFLGALILVGGSAGDHYGRRRIFAIGIVIFTVASIWCGLVPTTTQLIIARGVQGIGGALLVPSSLAIISATYTQEERGAAIGTWAGASALATAAGPILGGWLVDTLSWRWTFFVIVPFAVAALAITLWRMPETREQDTHALDWAGALLATAGLGALTYALIASSGRGWSDPLVFGALVAGVVLVGIFVWIEARVSAPMMPLGLFRSTTFSGANLLTLTLYFALNGTLFFLPFNLVQVQGYSATAAGAAFLPFTLLLGLLSRWAGGLVDRYGPKRPLIVGPVVVGIGLLLLMVPGVGGSYWTTFFPGLLLLGLGMTISVAPLTTVVMNSVEDEQVGVASGINNATARIAGLLAIAALGAIALSVFAGALDQQLADIAAPAAVKQTVWESRANLAALQVPAGVDDATRQSLEAAVDAAFVRSFRWVMAIAALLAFASALCAGLMIEEPADRAPAGARVAKQPG